MITFLFGFLVGAAVQLAGILFCDSLMHRERLRRIRAIDSIIDKSIWEARQGNFQEAKRLSAEVDRRIASIRAEIRGERV